MQALVDSDKSDQWIMYVNYYHHQMTHGQGAERGVQQVRKGTPYDGVQRGDVPNSEGMSGADGM